MRRTITLYAEPEDRLIETIRMFNQATNDILRIGFKNKIHNKIKLHHLTYYQIREKYGLPASLTTTARDCASEMLKREKCKKLPIKKPYSAIRYNQRTFSLNREKSVASFSSVRGRVKVPIHIPEYFRQYLDWDINSALIAFDGRKIIIRMCAETQTPSKNIRHGGTVLGVDTGICNHAVLSNNQFYNSKHIRAIKARYQYNRSILQAKGTRSAKRKLKKLVGREKRFMADTNHCVSKWIAHQLVDMIALEELSIKKKKGRGRRFNRMLGNWTFGQLQKFIHYKAEALGKYVVYVDPRFTSQKCSNCGFIFEGNRKRHEYRCQKCSFGLHADLNASRNISMLGKSELGRLLVNEPIVASSIDVFQHVNISVTSPGL
jgi:IS605 OrfB family transposase